MYPAVCRMLIAWSALNSSELTEASKYTLPPLLILLLPVPVGTPPTPTPPPAAAEAVAAVVEGLLAPRMRELCGLRAMDSSNELICASSRILA